MNPFAHCRALLERLEQEGVWLELVDGALELVGAPSAALDAQLAALFAVSELGAQREQVQAQVDRATAPGNMPVVERIGPQDVTELLARARDASAPYRALTALTAAKSCAARDVLVLDVSHLVGLPEPFTLTFTRRDTRCVCTTARQVYDRCVADGEPVFLVRELDAAACAVVQGRADPSALDRWIASKRRGPWQLSSALAGVLEHLDSERTLCCGELFDALGAELVDVELHERAPVAEKAS